VADNIYGEASWERIAAVDPAHTVAILPLGAVEAHGPHLPLATDVIIAEAMAAAAARRLARAGLDAWVLPALAYAPAPFAAEFAGTISIRPATLTAMIVDIARSLQSRGVRTLAIANAHLDPAHLAAVRAAGDALDGIAFAFPDLTRRTLAARLSDEFRSGACHAGRFETSIVLAFRPELVDDPLRASLPPVDLSLSDAIAQGKRTFAEVGGSRAYFGDPAAATATEGLGTVAELGRILEEAVLAATGAPDRGG
jgi:creatinine amidohydrolase